LSRVFSSRSAATVRRSSATSSSSFTTNSFSSAGERPSILLGQRHARKESDRTATALARSRPRRRPLTRGTLMTHDRSWGQKIKVADASRRSTRRRSGPLGHQSTDTHLLRPPCVLTVSNE
jgi:hypothetical protein